MEYASYLLYGKGFVEYTKENIMDWKCEQTIIAKGFGEKYYPPVFVELFKSFSSGSTPVILKAIDKCIKECPTKSSTTKSSQMKSSTTKSSQTKSSHHRSTKQKTSNSKHIVKLSNSNYLFSMII
jgi:hypothetical protein